MRWFLTICMLGTIVSCANQNPSAGESNSAIQPASDSAFTFEESNSRILLDTRVVPGQRRRFDIAQGSITIETIAASNGILTLRYTPEIEGGYSVYECKHPISKQPVIFGIDPSGVPGKTSFDLNDCERIKSGNLHEE